MSHERRDEDDLFRRAVGDVAPVAGPDRVPRVPRAPAPRPPRAARPRPVPQREPSLIIDGDRGHAPGVNLRQRADLAAGRVSAGMRIDLHGFRADGARELVRKRLADAVAAGVRCVLIVHGRGRHSDGAPVLREAVVEVLTSSPTVGLVRAFCPAAPADGGAGAMYVLLGRGPR